MHTIWKFPLEIVDEQEITAPTGFKPLSVQWQGGDLCLWCEVDTDNERRRAMVYIFGTGNPMHRPVIGELAYVGTVQEGALVWHVYTRS